MTKAPFCLDLVHANYSGSSIAIIRVHEAHYIRDCPYIRGYPRLPDETGSPSLQSLATDGFTLLPPAAGMAAGTFNINVEILADDGTTDPLNSTVARRTLTVGAVDGWRIDDLLSETKLSAAGTVHGLSLLFWPVCLKDDTLLIEIPRNRSEWAGAPAMLSSRRIHTMDYSACMQL